MAKIETTTKEFRAGIAVSATNSTVHWEPTGYLSVRLLDASGTQPVVGCFVMVNVPKEGTVTIESGKDGAIFYPDVPFQDYELDLGDEGKVTVPAVALASEQHICPVPTAKLAWVDLVIVDDKGLPVSDGPVSADDHPLERSDDEPGRANLRAPLYDNKGKTTVAVGDVHVTVALPITPVPTIVRLPKRGAS